MGLAPLSVAGLGYDAWRHIRKSTMMYQLCRVLYNDRRHRSSVQQQVQVGLRTEMQSETNVKTEEATRPNYVANSFQSAWWFC